MLLIRENRKISIIGGLLLMGLTLITGYAVYDVMRQQIKSSLGRGLDVALQGKGHLLESQIEKGLADTHAVVTRPFLTKTIKQLNTYPGDNNALHDLQRNLDSLLSTDFTAASVYNAHGNQLAQVGHFTGNQEPSLPLNTYPNTFLIWNGQFILRASEDIHDQDKRRIGSITTEKSLPQLTRSFGEIRSIGETGEFILCAPSLEDKQKVACLISQIDGVKFRYLIHMTDDGVVPPMNFALDGKSGIIAVKDYRQVSVIEAYAPLSVIGLGMILKLDEAELFGPVAKQLKIIVLYVAGLIAAGILLLNWFIRKLINSEREARRAKEKAEQFSVELSHKEIELRERLKEITCLYEIRRRTGPELSVETVCQNIFAYLIPAMQYPEFASALIELDGKRMTSMNHDLNLAHELKSEISVHGKVCGHLSVFYPNDKLFLELEEQRLIDAVVVDLARWLERKRIDEILHARLKEITCLYEIRRSMGQELSVENVCKNIFQQVIPALQFPELATAVIELDGRRFTSDNHDQHPAFEPSLQMINNKVCFGCYKQSDAIGFALHSKISANSKVRGHLSVFYPEDKPYLVREEQKLIDTVAADLAGWLERRQFDETLRERLKEITCLYEIRRGMGQEISVDNVCENIFQQLIPALQFPEIATAVIELDGWRYTSEKYNHDFKYPLQSKDRISNESRNHIIRPERDPACTCFAAIKVSGDICGQLRVFYPADKPFLLQEEQKLVDAIASDLGIWLERKRLEQALVFVAEEQAHSMGQELHDNLGQRIAAIGYQARALEKKLSTPDNENLAAVAASIAAQAQTAVVQTKQLAQGLLPFELESNGLITALQTLASRIAATYTITCDFLCKTEIIINDNNLALNLYRIAQEAANNAIRHGDAQHIIISLTTEKEMLVLSICDNGLGFNATRTEQETTQGMGIKIMQYRAKQLGANLEFLPRTKGGAEVRLTMRIV